MREHMQKQKKITNACYSNYFVSEGDLKATEARKAHRRLCKTKATPHSISTGQGGSLQSAVVPDDIADLSKTVNDGQDLCYASSSTFSGSVTTRQVNDSSDLQSDSLDDSTEQTLER